MVRNANFGNMQCLAHVIQNAERGAPDIVAETSYMDSLVPVVVQAQMSPRYVQRPTELQNAQLII